MTDVPPPPDTFSPQIEATLVRLERLVRAAGARHGVLDDEAEGLLQDVRIRLWRAHTDSEEIARLPTSYVYRTAATAAEETISLLGWSDAKVRNLLYRGLQDLRERLTQAGYRWPEES